jgi:hypothetical protein
MRRSQADIAVVAAVTVVYFGAAALGAPAAVLAVVGLLLAASPGYIWSEVLLSSRVMGLERAAVATGLALVVPVIGGLALGAAGIPLHRTTWAALFAGAALLGDAVLLALRWTGRRLPPGRRQRAPRLATRHKIALGAALGIAAGAVVLALAGAGKQQYPSFTQLWLLARDQRAHTASLGVSNHQGATTRYRLVLLRKARVSATWNLTLADGQSWQRVIPVIGTGTVAARLYRLPDLTHPYRYVSTADRSPGS